MLLIRSVFSSQVDQSITEKWAESLSTTASERQRPVSPKIDLIKPVWSNLQSSYIQGQQKIDIIRSKRSLNNRKYSGLVWPVFKDLDIFNLGVILVVDSFVVFVHVSHAARDSLTLSRPLLISVPTICCA